MTAIDVGLGGVSALPGGNSTVESMVAAGTGWYHDPSGQHQMRYFDGDGWTEHVTHSGPTPCRGCGAG